MFVIRTLPPEKFLIRTAGLVSFFPCWGAPFRTARERGHAVRAWPRSRFASRVPAASRARRQTGVWITSRTCRVSGVRVPEIPVAALLPAPSARGGRCEAVLAHARADDSRPTRGSLFILDAPAPSVYEQLPSPLRMGHVPRRRAFRIRRLTPAAHCHRYGPRHSPPSPPPDVRITDIGRACSAATPWGSVWGLGAVLVLRRGLDVRVQNVVIYKYNVRITNIGSDKPAWAAAMAGEAGLESCPRLGGAVGKEGASFPGCFLRRTTARAWPAFLAASRLFVLRPSRLGPGRLALRPGGGRSRAGSRNAAARSRARPSPPRPPETPPARDTRAACFR